MLEPHQVEELICIVGAMDRATVTQRLLSFHGTFPVDFSESFTAQLPLERLRHIFLALCLQQSQYPQEISAAA